MPEPCDDSDGVRYLAGFVDALSALLIVIIFLLMVFTLAQFFLGEIYRAATRRLND